MICQNKNGTKLLTVSDDSTARVWEVQTGKQLYCLKHPYEVYDGAMSHDGNKVAAICRPNYEVYLWDLQKESPESLKIDAFPIFKVFFSSDDEQLVCISHDFSLICDSNNGQEIFSINESGATFSFSSVSNQLITSSYIRRQNNGFYFSTIHDLKSKFSNSLAEGRFTFLRDSDKVVRFSADINKNLEICDLKKKMTLCTLPLYVGIQLIAIDRNQSKIASDLYQRLVIYKIKSAKKIEIPQNCRSYSLDFSKSGKQLISCNNDNTLSLFDTKKGDLLTRFKYPINVGTALFSNDHKHLFLINRMLFSDFFSSNSGNENIIVIKREEYSIAKKIDCILDILTVCKLKDYYNRYVDANLDLKKDMLGQIKRFLSLN